MAKNLLRLFQQTDPDKPLGGRYKVIRQLGEGGFGHTFLAEDLHLPGQPTCVVKQLKPQVSDAESLQTARRLFDTEAKVLYLLGSHDQIPRLLAHFEDNQEFYLAQELIEGQTLTEELVPGQPWPEVKVISLLQDILYALAFVHQQHVIHRDLKPANLIRRRRDSKIVLIDFGAVKQVSTQMASPMPGKTNMTISIGTQGYMPKEQLGGNPRFSSDVYAAGIIAIQALTGTHPRFLAEDPHTGEIIWHDRANEVSPELAAILDKMVRYDFRARYVTAAAALEALRTLPSELLESVPPPQPLPELSSAASIPNPEPPPPTATGQTLPIAGVGHHAPTVPIDPESVAKSSVPTAAVGSQQRLQRSGVSVSMQGFQQYGIKPWQIGAAFVALGATVWIGKGVFSPQTPPKVASQGSSATAVNPAGSGDSEKQAAALLSQGDRLRQAENYQEAITSYEKAITLKPDVAEAHWGLCYSLNQVGKPKEASAECDQALSLKPNYAEALTSKGNALHQEQNYQEEIKLYDQALKINPNLADAWNNKGVALLKLNRFDEAFAALEKATQLKPDWADPWANRGNALFGLKRYDDGFASLEKALQLDPNHPNANNLMQQARRQLGRYGNEPKETDGKKQKSKGKK